MSNDIQIFNNEEFGAVRTVQHEGEWWFVAKDICDVLGLTNPSMALAELEEDERSKYSLGRQGEANVINESGLYSLILRSRKPEAKKFKKWVTSEVLPSLRKTGSYSLSPQPTYQIPSSFAEALRLAANLQEEKEALEAKIEADKPKLEFTKAVENSENSILMRELATFIQQAGMDMGQNRLFKILRDEGYLIKSGNSRNKPTQRAKDMGLFEVKERVIEKPNGTSMTTSTTMVTGKGQVYFVMKFQEQLRNPKSKNTNIVSFPA